jgi:hypothetical protein
MIAISYRREDTAQITGRIYDQLEAVFGRDRVFMDLDSIPFGVDFRTQISEALKRCDTLLVVIGPHWLGVSPDGSRRIDDPTDFVRLEVAQGLAENIKVIPLLIDTTEMPSPSSLPEDLKSLAFRNALRVDSGVDFHHHIDRLCSSIDAGARHKKLHEIVGLLALLFYCIVILFLFWRFGLAVAAGIASATRSESMGFVGSIPTWLFGIWLTYRFWRHIRMRASPHG